MKRLLNILIIGSIQSYFGFLIKNQLGPAGLLKYPGGVLLAPLNMPLFKSNTTKIDMLFFDYFSSVTFNRGPKVGVPLVVAKLM